MPQYPTIAGQLPWGGGGGGLISSAAGTDPVSQQLGQSYQGAYDQALAFNRQNYGNILQGYQQAAQAQQANQAGIAQGYGQLSADVLGGLQGVGASRQQDIASAYQAQRGRATQDMINRGLGNSTVALGMQRGINLDEQRAQTDLANQLAQLRAGYQSQLGLAGLGYRGAAEQASNAQANRQLDWMNSVESAYPDAGAYGSLLAQRGAAVQAEASRKQAADQFGQMMDFARQGREQAGQQFQQLYGPRQQALPASGPALAGTASAPVPRRGSRPVNQPLPPQAVAPQAPPRPPGGIGAPMPVLRGGPAVQPMSPVNLPRQVMPPRGFVPPRFLPPAPRGRRGQAPAVAGFMPWNWSGGAAPPGSGWEPNPNQMPPGAQMPPAQQMPPAAAGPDPNVLGVYGPLDAQGLADSWARNWNRMGAAAGIPGAQRTPEQEMQALARAYYQQVQQANQANF